MEDNTKVVIITWTDSSEGETSRKIRIHTKNEEALLDTLSFLYVLDYEIIEEEDVFDTKDFL